MKYLLFTTVAFAIAPLPVAAQTPANAEQHQHHQAPQPQGDQHGQHGGHAMKDGCCADKNGNGKMDCCEKNDGKGSDQQRQAPRPEDQRQP